MCREADLRSRQEGRPARDVATEEPGRRAARREHRMIMFGTELGAVAHLLRDRRFQERVITGVIGLVALAGLARETRSAALRG